MQDNGQLALDIVEAAKRLSLSPRTVASLIKTGELGSLKGGPSPHNSFVGNRQIPRARPSNPTGGALVASSRDYSDYARRRVPNIEEFESSARAEVKTNKHKTLQLIRKQGTTHSKDLVRQFGYSPGTARSYLSHLRRQGLLEQVAGGYGLTAKGMSRVRYFDVFGCGGIACPLCKGKAGYLTCPGCGRRISKKDAKISKERDFLLVLRHAGVYCDGCPTLIVDEAQAQLLGIAREE